MDTLFPFGFPAPTAFYLTLYVVTLMIHVAFMNYVLAGTAYIALTRPRDADGLRVRPVIVSWMPLMLSGAITAGVAPLLFLQILYKREFYTANVLLFNRWMAILPVLIVGFYALYLVQSGWLTRRPRWLRTAVTVTPFLCVAFTGYSWTENHLLSVRSQADWVLFYGSETLLYYEPALIPRLLLWGLGAMPVFAAVVGWQLFYRGQRGEAIMPHVPTQLAAFALAGLALASAAGEWYWFTAGLSFRSPLEAMAWPYFVTAVVGWVVQAVAWFRVRRDDRFTRGRMIAIAVGVVLTVVGMTVMRESIRLQAIGPERFEPMMELHRKASGVGGLIAFVVFFAVNAGLIALCVFIVRNGRKKSDLAESE